MILDFVKSFSRLQKWHFYDYRLWKPSSWFSLHFKKLFVFHINWLTICEQDASSVRATYPIPASCGLYYFEVKIVSKGRDGYMGVGLCAKSVDMNRWESLIYNGVWGQYVTL